MGIFLPKDITKRLYDFINKKTEFPFIGKDEIIGTFYLFGKNHKVSGQLDIMSVHSLARKTIEQITRNIKVLNSLEKNKINTPFIREEYTKRILQISIDNRELDTENMNLRILRDPTILSNCFEQHIVYYKQDYFFKIINKPFEKWELIPNLVNKLEGRMLMVGYNTSDHQKLLYRNMLEPFFEWLNEN
jgi:hypothetical protein